ncbi:transcriptional regulator [Mucilaginibacter sp. AW1-3]
METNNLDHNIKVFCVTADSFPNGIEAAYNKLYAVAGQEGRTIYGLSKPEKGVIVYKAAVAENFDGEAEQSGLETLIIPKGEYAAETIHDWRNNMQKFSPVFMTLLDNPRLDRNSWCIEWYKNDDEVVCMVKLQ